MKYEASKFLEIPFSEVTSKRNLPFDIYIKLPSEKMVKVGKKNNSVPIDQLDKYKEKEILILHVFKSEYSTHTDETHRKAQFLIDKKGIKNSVKTSVVAFLAQKVFKDLEKFGLSKELLSFSQSVIDKSIQVLDQNKDKGMTVVLETLQSSEDSFMAHALATSSVAVMIGKKQEWSLEENFKKMALAGFFHDIGVKNLAPELQEMAIEKMKPFELTEYKQHPKFGYDLLSKISLFEGEIADIVHHHHEYAGQGYPQKLKDPQIHPLARVIGIADEFTNLVLDMKSYPGRMDPKDAIEQIRLQSNKKIREEDIVALAKLF